MKDLNSKILNKLGEIDSFIINNIRDRNLMRSFVQSLVINELTKEIKISKRETDFELHNFFKEKGISDNKDLKKYLLYYGITEKNLNYQIELPLKILKYAENNLHKKVNSHFLKRKESLDLYTYNIIRLENNDLASGEYYSYVNFSSNGNLSQAYPISLISLDDTSNLGDLNSDGELNILDVVQLVNIILYGSNDSYLLNVSDINQDENVNVLDIVQLVNLILI